MMPLLDESAALVTSFSEAGRPVDAMDPRPMLLPQVARRHWGRWATAVVLIAAVAGVVVGFSRGQILWSSIPGFMWSHTMLQALGNTICLAVVAQAVAIVVGTLLALMRTSQNTVLRACASAYIWLFRGMPVLLQIVIWYNLALVFPTLKIGLPFTGVEFASVPTNDVITAFAAAFLGLAMNESAYMAEIVRAGLLSVDRGQVEAAQSLGLTSAQRTRRVVLPQALRVIIPPTGNDFIDMIKSTSVASVIGYVELVRAANNISSANLLTVESLFAAAIWYLVLVTLASLGQGAIERRLGRSSLSGTPGPSAWRRVFRDVLRLPFVRVHRTGAEGGSGRPIAQELHTSGHSETERVKGEES